VKKVERVVLVFASVHSAMKAEKYLKSAQWPFWLIPLPPAINDGCGLGIQIVPADQHEVEIFLKQFEIVPVKSVTMK